jgi:hypothetical protein
MNITTPAYRLSRSVTFLAEQKTHQNALAAAGGVTESLLLAPSRPCVTMTKKIALVVFLSLLFAVFTSGCSSNTRIVASSQDQDSDFQILTSTSAVLNYADHMALYEDSDNCHSKDQCFAAIENLVSEIIQEAAVCPDGYTIVRSQGFFFEVSKVVIPIRCVAN